MLTILLVQLLQHAHGTGPPLANAVVLTPMLSNDVWDAMQLQDCCPVGCRHTCEPSASQET